MSSAVRTCHRVIPRTTSPQLADTDSRLRYAAHRVRHEPTTGVVHVGVRPLPSLDPGRPAPRTNLEARFVPIASLFQSDEVLDESRNRHSVS
jgi:hypothetical protein